MPRLPAELVDLFLDALRDDKPALRDCGAVSSIWLRRSRFYTFAAAHLQLRPLRWNTEDLDHVQTFLALAASPLATFIDSLVELSVDYHPLDDSVPLFRDILRPLEARGVRLQKLRLWGRVTTQLLSDWPPPFANTLVDLNIDAGDNPIDVDVLLNSICSCPLVERVRVTGSKTVIIDSTRPGRSILPPRLHTLETSYASLLQRINVRAAQLTTLGLVYFGLDVNWRAIRVFMQSPCVRNIETVNLVGTNPVDSRPDFSGFRSLRHIHVSYNLLCTVPRTLSILLQLLRNTKTHDTLETITVTPILLPGFLEFYPPLVDCTKLDELLVPRYDSPEALWSWPALRLLRIAPALSDTAANPEQRLVIPKRAREALLAMVWDNGLGKKIRGGKRFADALSRHLPRCVERGILRVDVQDYSTGLAASER
ncbi:hypothetical protein MKEN_00169600 [Mycena kentingensis (nom. inval.)]|nr:hypothetical protein MKEN_00169600 [Mycena kentingensis (nom. inval.)]